MSTHTPDLTKQAPRSPRVQLGGYAILPRLLDKARATTTGKNGEYHYNCPLDQRFLNFVGVAAEALQREVATGKGDGEILEWIKANAQHPRADFEIAAWSAHEAARTPGEAESREFFHGEHLRAASKRADIVTWFDLLDVDDYGSYGGKV